MTRSVFYAFCLLLVAVGCTPKTTGGAIPQEIPPHEILPPPPPTPLPTENQEAITGIPMDPGVRIGKLSNGMTYYIKANKLPENRAELRMALKAGAMQEDDDQLGLAHFIEHMAFNGSRNFTKNELVNYLESVGSRFGPDLNAYTSFDETVYMLQVRTDDQEQFDKGLLILRDWSEGIAFEDEEIDKERGVVISEWRSRLSSGQRMQNEYLPVLYYNSRYAKRLPIGDPEIVQNASYDVIKRFYADWYRPELMSIFVVGNIDPDQIEKQITEQFSTIVAKSPARTKESNKVPAHNSTLVKVVTDDEATNANVQIVYNHTYHKPKSVLDYRQEIVERLYNRMLGRRLSDISKQADPPFIFGYTGYGQDVGDLATYRSYASCTPKDVSRAMETLLDENQRVLQHGFTETELAREKEDMMKSAEQAVLEEDKLPSSRVVQGMIYHFLEDNPMPNAQQRLDMYNSILPTIQADEIGLLARKWITDKNRVVVITGPEKDRALLPDSMAVIRLMHASAGKTMEPYVDVDVSAPLLAGSFPARNILAYSFDDKLDIHHWSFENGVKVSAKATEFKNDEILMNGYSIGGHSLYSDEMYSSARSTSSVISSSGVGPFDATSLEKKLTGKQVYVRPFVYERFEGLSGSSSVADLETMMQLTYSWVTAFRKDTTALNSYLSKQRGMYGNLMSNPQNWYANKVSDITTQRHPRRGYPTLESYDQVDMNTIEYIYADRFKDVSDMHFFFVGNFDIDSLKQMTSRYLGALPGGGREEMWKDVGVRYPNGRIDSVFYRGEAPKSLVQLVYHGDDQYNSANSYMLESLIALARIKLREELREDQGGVYGVSVYGGQSKYPIEEYAIQISFNADPPRTNELIEAMQKVINKLKESVDPADIVKITETQRQSRIKDLEQNRFWMNSFVDSWLDGSNMYEGTQLESLEKKIAGLNEAGLVAAANKYFNDSNLISVVMFPENEKQE